MGTRWRLVVLAALFVLVTACGGGGDKGNEVASVSDKNAAAEKKDKPKGTDEDQLRAYAKCMREHGVDMPDPQPGTEGEVTIGGGGDDSTLSKATEACKDLLPNMGEPKPPTAEELDDMRKTAKCLREHGLNVPDPTPEKPFLEIEADSGNNDKVNKAMEECGEGAGGSVAVEEGK